MDSKVLEITVNGHKYWIDKEMFDAQNKFFAVREEILEKYLARMLTTGQKPTDAEEDEIYIKHGLTPPDRTPRRPGHFFMAHIGGLKNKGSKMLWQEPDGKVYDFKKDSTCPNVLNVSTEPYTGEWKYWRAVSGFDF